VRPIPQRSEYEQVQPEVLELLNRRADRLKTQELQDDQEDAVLWTAEFAIGEEQYAIPLSTLRAAVPLKMVTPVPMSPPQVIGVIRFQGEIVTVMSLASLLGGRAWRQDSAVLLVVDPGWGQVVALDCEQIPRPSALPMALYEQARTRAGGAIVEVATRDMRQVNVIDLSKLLDRRAKERGA
jgi:chemotaxis signal transduction protein